MNFNDFRTMAGGGQRAVVGGEKMLSRVVLKNN